MCLGSALDILQAGRPPRASFVDYPLGHSAGKPFASDDQCGIVETALRGFETLQAPGSIQMLANRWGDDTWRVEASSTEPTDTRQPRDDSPQFQLPADREAAITSGALRA
jgi:hypothetical protein